MKLKPYLQLVRLPNLFTAAADPLAGWIVARGSLEYPERWLPLVAASILIYAGGIVLNDVFDVEIDRAERPDRPLPSGRVPYRLAATLGGLALTGGPLVALLSGSLVSGVVAGLLALCVLLYDVGMKRTVFGPFFMGACRSGNLLLGFSQIELLGGPYAWWLAGSFGLFVAGVTWISRSEVESGQTRGIWLGFGLELGAMIGLTLVASGLYRALNLVQEFPLIGLVLWLVLIQIVGRATYRALRRPVPAQIQSAVKTGVLALVWLDVAVVTTVRDPILGLVVASLWVPAFLLGRWLYST